MVNKVEMKVKIVSLIMIAVLLVLSVPAYAVDENRTTTSEHIFTDAELACDAPVDPSVLSSASEDGFVPVNRIEGDMTRITTEYYIASRVNGKMLSSSSTNVLTQTMFNDETYNNHAYQKWRFSLESDGNYIVYAYNDSSVCLTVNPNSLTVSLSDDIGSEYQKWKMYYSSSGNALQCMATDSSVGGYKLVIGTSRISVSNTAFTPVGFINVSSYVPCTSISMTPIYIDVDSSRYVYPTYTPSNSSLVSSQWTDYSTSSSQVFTVTDAGLLSGIDWGSATLTVKNKITEVEGIASVYVIKSPNPDAQNKETWCWAAAAKRVGIHNGGGSSLNSGSTLLVNTDGVIDIYCGRNYNGAYTADTEQRQIVYHIHGSDGSLGGNHLKIATAMEYIAQNTVTVEILGNGSLSESDIGTLNNELAAGRWVVGNVISVSSGSGHSIVIQSYNASTGKYTFWDPARDRDYTFDASDILNDTLEIDVISGYSRLERIQICY